MRKAFVLLSGGIDSTTCLHLAMRDFPVVEARSIFYGQRHKREIDFAKQTCKDLGIPHDVLNVEVPRTMLTDPSHALPNASYDELTGVSPTYVPFRNGLMLAALASHVAGQWDDCHKGSDPVVDGSNEWAIYFGAHAEDAANWAYPDCTPEFIGAMAQAIYLGTYRGVRLHTPLQWLNKREIITLGDGLGVNWKNTWSCYDHGEIHCGTCPTCRARRAAFRAAGINDPTEYDIHARA